MARRGAGRRATGDGALVVATVDAVVQAMGTWRRERSPVFRTSAEVAKVMAHPAARGLGRRVVTALVADARDKDLELLTGGQQAAGG